MLSAKYICSPHNTLRKFIPLPIYWKQVCFVEQILAAKGGSAILRIPIVTMYGPEDSDPFKRPLRHPLANIARIPNCTDASLSKILRRVKYRAHPRGRALGAGEVPRKVSSSH